MTSEDSQAPKQKAIVWISRTDRSGHSVDPRFLEVASVIGGELLQYRASELGDASGAAELIEVAVHNCSRAARSRDVANPTAYLVRAYRRLVDAQIAKRRRQIDLAAASESLKRYDFESVMHDRIEAKKILDSMDEETRKLYLKRLAGFSVEELAREQNIAAKRLSERMRRGLRKALDRAFGNNAKQGE